MSSIHPSMDRLYQAAKELRNITGQSAVARLMESSPQAVKNWEKRGLSAEGALFAQRKMGCNANWLLDESGQMANTGWAPHPGAQGWKAEEPTPDYTWPFATVTVDQVRSLTAAQRKNVEENILLFLQAEAPSANQRSPQRRSNSR